MYTLQTIRLFLASLALSCIMYFAASLNFQNLSIEENFFHYLLIVINSMIIVLAASSYVRAERSMREYANG